MGKKEDNLLEFLGKYVQLQDGRKGFVLAPDGRGMCKFLTLNNRLGEMSFTIESDDGFRELIVWRELGTINNEPMQPNVIISDLRMLINDGKRFRELQRLLK